MKLIIIMVPGAWFDKLTTCLGHCSGSTSSCLDFENYLSRGQYPFDIINREVCHYWGTVYSWWENEMFWVEA
ncbi:hypothetical protein CHISP_3469 [Chitinispirillum alkaliphilum]|nr:hypothetical protein CHISP_3469 [Chitinispirillum alkaliphilum]